MTKLRPYEKHHSDIHASLRRQSDRGYTRFTSILVLHYEIVMFDSEPSAMKVMHILMFWDEIPGVDLIIQLFSDLS